MDRKYVAGGQGVLKNRFTVVVVTAALLILLSSLVPVDPCCSAQEIPDKILSWELIGFSDLAVESVEVDPNNESTIYAALAWGMYDDAGIWKTTDAGGNWSQQLNASMYGISVDPRDSNKLCVVGEDIYTSDNGGSSWDLRKDDVSQCDGLRRDPNDPDVLYAFAQGGHIYKSINNGLNWADCDLPVAKDIKDLAVDPADSQTVYASAWGAGIYKSTSGGAGWTLKNNGIPAGGSPNPDGLDVDPSRSGKVYAAVKGHGIYETTNGGDSWSVRSNGIPTNPATTEVLIKTDDSSVIYAGLDTTCYASRDGGDSWTKQEAGLDLRGIRTFSSDPNYPDNIYAAGNSYGAYEASWITPPATSTWYLAEGSTDWGFSCYISIENPNNEDVTAKVTYMTTEGPEIKEDLYLPAMSQTRINPDSDLGAADFSTKVECKEGKPIAVDRTMFWWGPDAAGRGTHCSIGVNSPNKTWYLPEGSSDWGFECWLLIQNPNGQTANCTITYMIEGGEPVVVNKQVQANSRNTFNMADDIGQKDASIMVDADVPVIPERAMYRNNRREGHDSIGTTTPAQDYYLAEGTTDWGFTTYVLVQNPNSSVANVTMTYMTNTGPQPQPPFAMDPNSRKTIRVNDVLPARDLSTHVHADKPIIAERAMYWDSGYGEACHDSIGMDSAHSTFYLPDGETYDAETWTLVQNPNSTDVQVRIYYMTPSGDGNVDFTDTVPANSRKTYNMADRLPASQAAIMVQCVTSGKKIMVERAMYWDNRVSGADTIGGYTD